MGPRSHMLLLVELGGSPYIADVGFGGNVLTGPLRLVPHVTQNTPHEPHRLVPVENGFVLEGFFRDEWKPLYRFTLEPAFPADYEVSNWYLCHHPNSFFRQILIGARVTPEGRYALRNNTLTVHRSNQTERRTLSDAAVLRSSLEIDFGIRLPDSPELVDLLDRVSKTPADPNS
jgi:N-hydroxyarylamine O-acetyltransferase